MTLVEMRYDKQALAPYEAAYEAESEGCYGTLGNALQIIMRLSVQKRDAMKLLGGCFSNLSIQDERVLSDVAAERADPISVKPCVGEQTSIADRMTDDAPEPSPIAARSDTIAGTPKKRCRASQQEPMEDQPVEQEPLLVLFGAPIGGVVNRDR